MFIFPVQLTASRIGNLIRLILTLLYVMTIPGIYHLVKVARQEEKSLADAIERKNNKNRVSSLAIYSLFLLATFLFSFFDPQKTRVKNARHLQPSESTLGLRPSVFLTMGGTPFLRPLQEGDSPSTGKNTPYILPSSSTQYTSHPTHLGFDPRFRLRRRRFCSCRPSCK